MDTRTKLKQYFNASYPGIAIETTEEQRAVKDAMEAAKLAGKNVVTWSATEGLRQVVPTVKDIPDTEDLVAAFRNQLKNTVYIFRDIHTWPFDQYPIMSRGLRDLLTWCPSEGSAIVVIAPSYKPHGTCEKLITMMDFTLPNASDLERIAKGIEQSAGQKCGINDSVIMSLGGLSTTEAENALSLSLIETGKFCPDVIYREKIQAVRKTGLLDIVEPDKRGLDSIGGLEELKAWILRRKRAYTKEAAEYGLPSPKGVLLVGVPGTGKSLSAKAFGIALEVPTLRLDIGSLFNSLIGESEARTRDALKLAEAMAPCVLWIDEIDKGLAGSSGSGSGDSGVTKRVFGSIISWMQERRRPVFMVATANNVEGLPPEILRKGRFDEIFAVDLPRPDEREAIFKIHLSKRNRKPDDFDLTGPVESTENFTGSEIENVLDEALFSAFDQNREIVAQDLVNAAQATTPLAVTAKEQIDGIRQWAASRARFASSKTAVGNNTGKRRFTGAIGTKGE